MLSVAAQVRVGQNALMTLFTRARALTCGTVLALLVMTFHLGLFGVRVINFF